MVDNSSIDAAGLRFLIIAESTDDFAIGVYLALRERAGVSAVKIVSPLELALSTQWMHSLDDNNGARSRLCFRDGVLLDSEQLVGVLNRISRIPLHDVVGGSQYDREYAVVETHALWLSFLTTLRLVINPPSTRWLPGSDFAWLEWLVAAQRIGIPVVRPGFVVGDVATKYVDTTASRKHAVSSRITVENAEAEAGAPGLWLPQHSPSGYHTSWLVGDSDFSTPAGISVDSLVQLASVEKCELLELQWWAYEGGWYLYAVTPFPVIVNDEVISAVVGRLMEGGRS